VQEYYPENRFGELGRRDTFEYSKDWGQLHPIAVEVGDKIKEVADKVCDKVHGKSRESSKERAPSKA